MTLYVGDDWSEDHHDIQLMNEAGEQLAARRLPEGVSGSRRTARTGRRSTPRSRAKS